MQPSLPLPAPYMCSDQGSFAEHTLLVRLPAIARRMIAENNYSEAVLKRIDGLLNEIPDQPVRRLDDPLAPDLGLWDINFQDWLGLPWRKLSFLAAEKYFYRRILEATGYFQPGPTYLQDPYWQQKELGLRSSGQAVRKLVGQVNHWRVPGQDLPLLLRAALLGNLWANRADLSIWPAGGANTLANEDLHQADHYLYANDLEEVVPHLIKAAGSGKPIHILVDNAGFEVIGDLALADIFLYYGLSNKVVFHLKAHPTFVSDALIKDLSATIEYMASDPDERVSEFGRRLVEHLADHSFMLESDFFWNAPLAFWNMPDPIRRQLGQASLVISKGDANYRRLTGDLRWPPDTQFESVASYFPAPLLALRVAKSDVVVGLQPGQSEELDRNEADWRTNGRWGCIQFRK